MSGAEAGALECGAGAHERENERGAGELEERKSGSRADVDRKDPLKWAATTVVLEKDAGLIPELDQSIERLFKKGAPERPAFVKGAGAAAPTHRAQGGVGRRRVFDEEERRVREELERARKEARREQEKEVEEREQLERIAKMR
eukprot:gene9154-10658_t